MAVQAQNLSYRAFFEHETSRMLFEGALPVDIERIFAQVEEEGAWIKSWKTLGASEEQKAKEAKKGGFQKTAYTRYIYAANCYRLAQYHLLQDIPEKQELLSLSMELYEKAIDLSEPKILKIQIPFHGIKIKGYLHLPNKSSHSPCVICIPGLGHNKESMHNWCQYGVQRGMAVFCGDGYGYGETRVIQGKRLNIKEFDKYVEVVIDYLSTYSEIEANQIGIIGDCFGGYLAFRAAAMDKRIKGCALVEAILEFGQHQLHNNSVPALIIYHLDENEIRFLEKIGSDFYKPEFENTCPIYIVHAETDKLIPISLAKNLFNFIKGEKYLKIVKGKTCYNNYFINHYNTVLDELSRCVPDVWDWIGMVLKRTF